MRDAHNISAPRDWSAAKALLLRYNSKFTVFGGEPLLTPIEHLEEVFQLGYERFGSNGIQTNGTLITDEHVELFKKYRVGVGISCDGPGELSEFRVGSVSSTDATLGAIDRLCKAGHFPSLIVTLSRSNATSDRLADLVKWFREMEAIGVTYVNLHNLEIERGLDHLGLSDEDTLLAFRYIYHATKGMKMPFAPFDDIRKLLTEDAPSVTCTWNNCDPLTTAAVQGVTPDGVQSNCGRTNKDGVNWVKGDRPGFERYLALYQTPQEFGGCKDCRFFLFCKGHCPGTAIDGDWRNRTRDCALWYGLFETVEAELLQENRLPISRETERYKKLEKAFFDRITGEQQTDSHGDSPHGDSPHGDRHGDSPHGDSHMDFGLVSERKHGPTAQL